MSNKRLTNALLAAVFSAAVVAPVQAESKEKHHDVSAVFQKDSANFDGDKAVRNDTSIRAKSILMRQEKKR